MRVEHFTQENVWTIYTFDTTYPMSWSQCLAYAEVVYSFLDDAEILTCGIGEDYHTINIKDISDIHRIPEAGYVIIRGHSKVYDGQPVQHRFYNQTSKAFVEIPTQYVNNMKKDESHLLDDEGKKHILDKYMDSIEINGEYTICKQTHLKDIKALLTAIKEFKDFNGEMAIVYKNKQLGTEVNISELCEKVVNNYNSLK